MGSPINWISPNPAIHVRDDDGNVNLASFPIVEDKAPLRGSQSRVAR